jgi:hypothetical protein
MVVSGSGALASFLYFLGVRDTSVAAGYWALLSGFLTVITGILNIAFLRRADRLRDAKHLRAAIIVSMPSPLVLAGLALTGIGLKSDLLLVLGSSGAVVVFLVGVGLFIRYVYLAAGRS